jgi:hypothetical protein
MAIQLKYQDDKMNRMLCHLSILHPSLPLHFPSNVPKDNRDSRLQIAIHAKILIHAQHQPTSAQYHIPCNLLHQVLVSTTSTNMSRIRCYTTAGSAIMNCWLQGAEWMHNASGESLMRRVDVVSLCIAFALAATEDSAYYLCLLHLLSDY